MDVMDSTCETVFMPDKKFRIKSLVSSAFEHVIAVHPHWHSEIEILYTINGCAKQQVNDHFFTTDVGDIVIINKDQLHSTYSYQGSKCEILVIMFDSSEFIDYFTTQQDNDNSVKIFENYVIFKSPIKSDDEQGKLLLSCILDIHEELENKQNAYQYIVKSLLYRMGGMLLRSDLFQADHRNMKNIRLARQVLEKTFKLIDESYSEEISLKKAASISNLSTPHFCRLFKKTTGMTFNDYLSFYRVNIAEGLLHSQKTITEVALECGFGSSSSFIRSFKKHKKCTPSYYRKL